MKREYRYGLLCGIGLSVWILIEFALGFHTTSLEIGQYSGYFSFFIPVVIIYAALKEQSSKMNGIISVKEGMNIGFQIAIYSAVVFTFFLYVYNNYINPEWLNSLVEWQRKKLLLGGASDDEIERFMDQNRRMNNAVGQGVMSFISTTGIGIFITLIELPIIRMISKRP
jgi:hypothetical protein